MGFAIYSVDKDGEEVAYLRTYMGAFRMCREQGYDWFELIDAIECDGGVSGTGEEKQITLENLKEALEMLEKHDPKGKLSSENRDEWSYRKPLLRNFMKECIKHCEDNGRPSILIQFH